MLGTGYPKHEMRNATLPLNGIANWQRCTVAHAIHGMGLPF